jgi:predicted DNA-binding transcriptional regulator YafY
VKESRWHRSQKFADRKDGSTVMTLTLRNLDEIKSWILSFGPLAKVLAPVELVESLQRDVEAMRRQYSEC